MPYKRVADHWGRSPSSPEINADLIAWSFSATSTMSDLDARLLAVLAERSDSAGEGGCLTVNALRLILGCEPQETLDALGRLMEAGVLSLSLWSPAHLESWRLLVPGQQVGGGV